MTDQPLRQRDGDQALPVAGRERVTDALIEDLRARTALGIQRYGRPLETFNGRDALKDALEECLDLAQYLKQALMERDALTADARLAAADALAQAVAEAWADAERMIGMDQHEPHAYAVDGRVVQVMFDALDAYRDATATGEVGS